MRLLALLLLVANLAFLGWRYMVEEEDRLEALRRNPPTPAGVPRLQVLPLQAAGPETPTGHGLERIETTPVAAPEAIAADTASDAQPPNDASASPQLDAQTASAALDPPIGSGVCVKNGPFDRRVDANPLLEWTRSRATRLQVRQEALPGVQRYALYLVPASVEADAQSRTRPLEVQGLDRALLLGVLDSREQAAQRATQASQPGYQPLVVPRVDARAQWFVEAELADGYEDIGEMPAQLVPGGAIEQMDCSAL